MKTLFVTDLDGTLLRQNDTVSPYSKNVINKLVASGISFTYATARSYNSSSIVTKGLEVSAPVILYNGALIMDNYSKKIISRLKFSNNQVDIIKQLLEKNNISPLIYSLINGTEKVLWQQGNENYGMLHYINSRKNDKRLTPLLSGNTPYTGDIFYITCIGDYHCLKPVYDRLKEYGGFNCVFQQEIYRQEFWLEIMPAQATKAKAILRLKEEMNFDKLVTFGDAINDIPMFQISDDCYATSNGSKELKEIATEIIESNENDAVAKKLLQLTGVKE